MSSVTIDDLPEPIIEYIFSYLSPYRDLKQCMLVCKTWQRHVYDVVRKTRRDFNNAITNMTVHWSHLNAEPGPTISKRYSHSACCVGDSMYVFGGCTTASTTFNDLWRLDLASRCWIRPLATGTYPPPKACASLVHHNDNLILFGGWTHTSPYPLHQVWRVFCQLHLYNIHTNRWSLVSAVNEVPAMAGHCATVHGDMMVVFGGIHRKSNEGSFTGIFTSSNSVWTLDLNRLIWTKKLTSSDRPAPRYGHSQIYLDRHHILIIGGCGGPNRLFSDIWLLTMNDDPQEKWQWTEMQISSKENSAPHLAFHTACKVGKQVVVMSKGQRSRTNPLSLYLIRNPSRTWTPPLGNTSDSMDGKSREPTDVELCVNGKRGVLKRQFEKQQQSSVNHASSSDDDESRDTCKKLASSSLLRQCKASSLNSSVNNTSSTAIEPSTSHSQNFQLNESVASTSSSSLNNNSQSSINGLAVNSSASKASSFTLNQEKTDHPSPRPPLSIKPNARRNRQRQLEGLDRMEQKLRNLRAAQHQDHQANHQSLELLRYPLMILKNKHKSFSLDFSNTTKNPMTLYVLDISTAITNHCVAWLPVKDQSPTAPDEIILYSFVLGRGELIMFGGVQKDLKQHQEGEHVPEVVSNSLHFMSAQRFVI